MSHSKGNWFVKNGMVLTDNREGFKEETGHVSDDYYGKGNALIAESIMNADDAKLIAAAPDLLECLQMMYDEHGSDLWSDKRHKVEVALAKATIGE